MADRPAEFCGHRAFFRLTRTGAFCRKRDVQPTYISPFTPQQLFQALLGGLWTVLSNPGFILAVLILVGFRLLAAYIQRKRRLH